MKKEHLQLSSNTGLSNYTVTDTIHQGQAYKIVPVIMMVEGVLNGSRGPLLHTAEEFGKFPESWNGIPVVINHPQEGANFISANSPSIVDNGVVGRIYNTHVDGNRLKAEAWLDTTKLGIVSDVTANAISANEILEVSVGVYTEEEDVTGDWNGTQYNAIARNHRPDHLALLPGGIGACSVEAGCGIRANSKNKKGGQSVENRLEVMTSLRNEGFTIHPIVDNSSQGLREKLDCLRELVGTLDIPGTDTTRGSWNYLEEAYDDYLIYSNSNADGETYYKRNYQFSVETEKAEFTSEPVEVKKKIEYETVMQTNGLTRTKFKKEEVMAKERCTPCVEKKVNALIANKLSKFEETDRTWLEVLEESVLDKMVPEEVTAPIVNTLSVEDKAALDYGKKLLAQKKADLKATIVANTAEGLWTPEILDNMDDSMLERIAKTLPKEEVANYALNAGGGFQANNTSNQEMLLPAGVEAK